ncbi:MAG: hypothetical protein Q4F29_13595, partial [Lachnospiraceae bacterium]|nr:hypothetical protein [Lachnospiraceae bacterium]
FSAVLSFWIYHIIIMSFGGFVKGGFYLWNNCMKRMQKSIGHFAALLTDVDVEKQILIESILSFSLPAKHGYLYRNMIE